MRAVDEDGAGARCDRSANFREIGAKCARCERHTHRFATGQLNIGHIAVVAGIEHDDFIAWMHDGQNDGENRLGCTCSDGYLATRVIAAPVKRFNLESNSGSQCGRTGHRRILVVTRLHSVGDGIDESWRAFEVRETLAKVDRIVLPRPKPTSREDGGAYLGQFAGE